jgi:chemotaxis-related protein WspD
VIKGQNVNVKGRMSLPRMVIVRKDNEQYAFPVSEILSILAISNDQIEMTPATVNKSSSNFVTGVVSHDDFKIGIISITALFTAINRNIL